MRLQVEHIEDIAAVFGIIMDPGDRAGPGRITEPEPFAEVHAENGTEKYPDGPAVGDEGDRIEIRIDDPVDKRDQAREDIGTRFAAGVARVYFLKVVRDVIFIVEYRFVHVQIFPLAEIYLPEGRLNYQGKPQPPADQPRRLACAEVIACVQCLDPLPGEKPPRPFRFAFSPRRQRIVLGPDIRVEKIPVRLLAVSDYVNRLHTASFSRYGGIPAKDNSRTGFMILFPWKKTGS